MFNFVSSATESYLLGVELVIVYYKIGFPYLRLYIYIYTMCV